jgi:hypothetical protein
VSGDSLTRRYPDGVLTPHRPLALVALAVALAGCGGGGTPDGNAAKPTVPPSTATTISKAQRAKALVLVAADLPSFSKRPPTVTTPGAIDAFKGCEKTSAALSEIGAGGGSAAGDSLVRLVDGISLQSQAVVADDPARAERALADFGSAAFGRCLDGGLQSVLAAGLPKGTTVQVRSTPTTEAVKGAEQTGGFNTEAAVRGPSGAAVLKLTLVGMRTRGAIGFVFYTGPTTTVTNVERTFLLGLVATRLQSA